MKHHDDKIERDRRLILPGGGIVIAVAFGLIIWGAVFSIFAALL